MWMTKKRWKNQVQLRPLKKFFPTGRVGILSFVALATIKRRAEYDVHESLSSEKNSVSRSSEAKRSSFELSFFPMAVEFMTVSSRAITTTGTGVTVFAVFGL